MPDPTSDRLRIGRFSERGRLYLLTCVVAGREPIFKDLIPARLVVQQFRLAQTEGAASSLAWVVMPDHIHWLVELNDATLAVSMRRFKARSAYSINRVRQASGRLWQKRGSMTVHCVVKRMSVMSPGTSLPIHREPGWSGR